MSFNLRIQSQAVDETLDALTNKARVPRPALQKFARWATRREIPSNFMKSVNPYGERWKELAPATLTKERVAFGTKPLVKTGALARSFRFRTSGDNDLKIFSTKKFFVYHQSTKPRKRLPRRSALPDSDRGFPLSWRNRIKEEIELHLR